MTFLFLAKMLDNALSTAKTILIQRNRCLLAGICLAVSNYIYLLITKALLQQIYIEISKRSISVKLSLIFCSMQAGQKKFAQANMFTLLEALLWQSKKKMSTNFLTGSKNKYP